jgi:hypothetical protein
VTSPGQCAFVISHLLRVSNASFVDRINLPLDRSKEKYARKRLILALDFGFFASGQIPSPGPRLRRSGRLLRVDRLDGLILQPSLVGGLARFGHRLAGGHGMTIGGNVAGEARTADLQAGPS